jgi:hypothetical protein
MAVKNPATINHRVKEWAVSESITITSAYAVFVLATIIVFQFRPVFSATAVCYFGGWLFLPVAHYPADTITAGYFTVNVIGTALPSNLGVTKACVIPAAIILGFTLKAPQIWSRLRPTWLDASILAYCAWPLIAMFIARSDTGIGVWASAYLIVAWGGSWLIGRVIFADESGRGLLLRTIAWSGVALIPIALAEGVSGPFIYTVVYGDHAFLLEGAKRYVGYRPLGFFEHGNQFGIWIALSALAWWALVKQGETAKGGAMIWAIVTTAMALGSQSAGAILLLGVGAAILFLTAKKVRGLAYGMTGLSAMFALVYLSGALPVENIARNTAFGQKAIEIARASGRGSIGYRVRRDQMALAMLHREPVAGYGRWDWWRPLGSHPWGLPLLIAGQFGAVGLLLAFISLLWAPLRALLVADMHRFPLAIVVLLASADAALNSYIFFPAIVASAAIVTSRKQKSSETGRANAAQE